VRDNIGRAAERGGGFVNYSLVVIGDTKVQGDSFANVGPAGTKLASDGDNKIFAHFVFLLANKFLTKLIRPYLRLFFAVGGFFAAK